MKKLEYLLVAFLLIGTTSSATTTTTTLGFNSYRFANGYGNSFIFVEQGIEFAVFPDGQFDFNVNTYGPKFNAMANFGGVSISFNTGYNYNAYVQYDDFGAVVQIENVPIYYDYYGRIVQAGNIFIRYNNRGFVSRVGGLRVYYNRFNRFSYCTGFINTWNRYYVYRPWHAYYAIPVVDYCVVYSRPYRRYYRPVRHAYYRPYRDNFRPRVSYNAGRRDNAVARHSGRRSDRYKQSKRNGEDAIANNTTQRSLTDRTGIDRNVRPSTIKKDRPGTVQRGGPEASSNRIDKQKPRVTQNKKRNDGVKQKRRVASSRQAQRPPETRKRVSTNNKRKTNTVAKRSKHSSEAQVKQRSASTKKSKARTSSSRGKSSASKERNAKRRTQ